jgi:hypothetical protein
VAGEELVALFRSALTRVFDEAAAFQSSQGGRPKPGSIAHTELSTYVRPESIRTVFGIAAPLLESVAEHMLLFVKTITEPVNPLGAWTCVRSMMESASIAAWLLDPTIDARTRVQRTFAHRYEGMDEELKLLRAMRAPATDIHRVEAAMSDAENVAVMLGFGRIRDKKNRIAAIGMRMLGATDIIKTVLDEEVAYRLLSAVAHGHGWALRDLGYKQAGAAYAGADGVVVTPIEKHSGTVHGYSFLAARAATSLACPLWNQCLYFGWDRAALEALLESVYDELQGPAANRFWR